MRESLTSEIAPWGMQMRRVEITQIMVEGTRRWSANTWLDEDSP